MIQQSPLPVAAAVHLAGAVDALKLADAALSTALNAMAGVELEDQPPAGVDSYHVMGIQSTVRLFLGLFLPAADPIRFPPCAMGSRRHIHELIEDERNPPGLERAAFALDLAAANFDVAIDALDQLGDDEGFYGPCVAARHCCETLATVIASSIVRRHGPGPEFGLN